MSKKIQADEIRAWRVYADGGEAMVIAFAATRNEARRMGSVSEWLCCFDWLEIRAKREPRADEWAGDTPELLDGSGKRSAEIMHALGWQAIDSPSCEWCGAGEWEEIPESRVEHREEYDGQEICAGCWQHEESKGGYA